MAGGVEQGQRQGQGQGQGRRLPHVGRTGKLIGGWRARGRRVRRPVHVTDRRRPAKTWRTADATTPARRAVDSRVVQRGPRVGRGGSWVGRGWIAGRAGWTAGHGGSLPRIVELLLGTAGSALALRGWVLPPADRRVRRIAQWTQVRRSPSDLFSECEKYLVVDGRAAGRLRYCARFPRNSRIPMRERAPITRNCSLRSPGARPAASPSPRRGGPAHRCPRSLRRGGPAHRCSPSPRRGGPAHRCSRSRGPEGARANVRPIARPQARVHVRSRWQTSRREHARDAAA